MSKRKRTVSLAEITQSTDEYVENFQEYDIKTIIETMLQDYELDDEVYVFEYPGLLPIDVTWTSKRIKDFTIPFVVGGKRRRKKLSDVMAPRTGKRWNFGVFSVDLGLGAAHYVAIVLDNVLKRVYLWDSALSTPSNVENEVLHIVRTLFPDYTIQSTSICSGCRVYQPGAGAGGPTSYARQNIFCHTWSLWFLEQIMKNNLDVEGTIEALNQQCGTSATNLILIKQYAGDLARRYLGFDPDEPFYHIWRPIKKVPVKIPKRGRFTGIKTKPSPRWRPY